MKSRGKIAKIKISQGGLHLEPKKRPGLPLAVEVRFFKPPRPLPFDLADGTPRVVYSDSQSNFKLGTPNKSL